MENLSWITFPFTRMGTPLRYVPTGEGCVRKMNEITINNLNTKYYVMGLSFAGNLFLIILLSSSIFSEGYYPHGILTYYLVIVLSAIIWNVLYAYFILNCPRTIHFNSLGLSIVWRRSMKNFYPLDLIIIEKIGHVKVIRIKDIGWKLPRYLFVNGWLKEYNLLLSSIEALKSK